ncbi:MAG: acyl-CoA thioesterase [Chitinophagaceae bacterium]
MENFTREVQVRWSDLDPNVHLRHSVYYDWGAFCRISFLGAHKLSTELMQQLQIGPILFREECVFKKEIRLGDKVTINLQIIKSKKDFSRWTIQHTIMKNKDSVAAIITVDGAWLNIAKRKLAIPPAEVADVFSQMPLAENFQWLD